MLVLVGCEFSIVVREAFRSRGHEAYSCDLRPAPGAHFEMDLLDLLSENYHWDLAVHTLGGQRCKAFCSEESGRAATARHRLFHGVHRACKAVGDRESRGHHVVVVPQARPDNSAVAIWTPGVKKNMSVVV